MEIKKDLDLNKELEKDCINSEILEKVLSPEKKFSSKKSKFFQVTELSFHVIDLHC